MPGGHLKNMPCVMPSLQVWYGIWWLHRLLDGHLVPGQKRGRLSNSPIWWECTSYNAQMWSLSLFSHFCFKKRLTLSSFTMVRNSHWECKKIQIQKMQSQKRCASPMARWFFNVEFDRIMRFTFSWFFNVKFDQMVCFTFSWNFNVEFGRMKCFTFSLYFNAEF